MSQMPQLSKSRHQRSICAGVTRAGSSTNDGQHAGLVPAGVPEGGGELVVAPEALGQHLDVGHRHAEGLARGDAEPRQVLAVALGAHLLEPRKRRLNLVLKRPLRSVQRHFVEVLFVALPCPLFGASFLADFSTFFPGFFFVVFAGMARRR